ncbi:DUF2812 domain-containing protein [Chakrabartyella piscis]|uniref:DUF2812 domain-containing protein n=1 Tax=Chakrabartyella piscis TaxID=2918914 RepID=UPI002958CD8C|nr:DUF2812 domain-containing protein [Chakrabartyella piscis]
MRKKDTVKKSMMFQYNHYTDLERKLEKYATQGLFLESIGSYFWTFRRGEPKAVHYTVTFFAEGSIFHPHPTENQEVYYDYAEASGWHFIAEHGQMQIFMSEEEQPTPFETDEGEKFENIKKCMNKSILPVYLSMLVLFGFNIWTQRTSITLDPIRYLTSKTSIYVLAMYIIVILMYGMQLVSYVIWLRRSEKSIALGGGCIEKEHRTERMVQKIFLCGMYLLVLWFLFAMGQQAGLAIVVLSLAYIPIVVFVFQKILQLMKKKAKSTMVVRVVSICVLMVTVFAYLGGIGYWAFRFDIGNKEERPYRTVEVVLSANATMDYEIFSDAIPLTAQDLYPDASHPDYSYEKEMEETIFMKQTYYYQGLYPMKNPPPEIRYNIVECKMDWTFDVAMDYLLEVEEWRTETTWEEVDATPFGADKAYHRLYDGEATGTYHLCYGNTIVSLFLEEALTDATTEIVVEKLELPR